LQKWQKCLIAAWAANNSIKNPRLLLQAMVATVTPNSLSSSHLINTDLPQLALRPIFSSSPRTASRTCKRWSPESSLPPSGVVRELIGRVCNVVLMNVYLGLENPGGSGFRVGGYMSQVREMGKLVHEQPGNEEDGSCHSKEDSK
jgi:hypothetical protein